jgi:hypothetical protein
MFPFLQLSYRSTYYALFGKIEKQITEAMHPPPPPVEAAPQPEGQDAQAVEAPPPPPQQQQQRAEDRGIWATIRGVTQFIAGIFGEDNEVVVQAEVRVANGNGELNADDEAQIEAELVLLAQEVEREAAEIANLDQNPAAEAGDIPQVQPQPNDAEDQPAENNAQRTTISDVINNVTTSLLVPVICFGMGELLRVTLPSRLVSRPTWGRPHGLLQERWGRSLVGGCLYVVVKDMLYLYGRYRWTYLRHQRKVVNVKRRR